MSKTREKLVGQSKYYLKRLMVYFCGYSIAWAVLFFIIKLIASDVAYGVNGIRNEFAACISAYVFEVMLGIWICIVIVALVYQWKKLMDAFVNQEEEGHRKKNEMLAYLAHDLRTPLTSVLGYAHILNQMDHLETEEAKTYIRIILEKSQLLEDMLDEFFEVTKLETGNVTLDLQELNLAEMLQQIVSEYIPILKEKKLTLQCDIIPQANVRCDAVKMERVFDNLMRNAVKYAPEDSNLMVSGKLEENQFLMCFKNEAEPMNEEQLTNMFESFVRLDEARNEMEGSGMGLTIVKEIIELHQGNIWAEYEAGKLYVCIKMALFC